MQLEPRLGWCPRAGARAHVGYVSAEGARHAMLGRHAVGRLAEEFARAVLLGHRPSGVLARIESGERHLRV